MFKRSDKASAHSGLDFVFPVLCLFQTRSYVITTFIIKRRILKIGNSLYISLKSAFILDFEGKVWDTPW